MLAIAQCCNCHTAVASPIVQESEDESGTTSDSEDSDFWHQRHHNVASRAEACKGQGQQHAQRENKRLPPTSQTVKEVIPGTVVPPKAILLYGTARASTSVGRPPLTVRTQGTSDTPLAALITVLHAGRGQGRVQQLRPDTHTLLWRRGLNGELSCDACGLYCQFRSSFNISAVVRGPCGIPTVSARRPHPGKMPSTSWRNVTIATPPRCPSRGRTMRG
ncbi:hypothetical protein LshimejAT787_1200710 [Lyophyllum shimeji]|uniref:GATA-type domain-containing protein n=1 Tax=Lyophyllum shimeji TaxID=47721 RepID=A0A9P3PTL7_LYOSH|nr:hypothetical protein LshimejAT787_1200710 [Lyophyllum shimeji]